MGEEEARENRMCSLVWCEWYAGGSTVPVLVWLDSIGRWNGTACGCACLLATAC